MKRNILLAILFLSFGICFAQKEIDTKLLQGKWQSVDDKTHFLIFTNNLIKQTASGMDGWDATQYTLSKGPTNEIFINKIVDKKIRRVFGIEYLDNKELSLTYLSRGNNLSYKRVETNNSDNSEDITQHFYSFLNARNSDELLEINKQHKPTINDCKLIFKKDFYKTAYQNINYGYNSFDSQKNDTYSNLKDKKYCRISSFNTNDIINNTCAICPGRLQHLASKLNANITCYIVEFLKYKDSERGFKSTFFVKINDRWVYFP